MSVDKKRIRVYSLLIILALCGTPIKAQPPSAELWLARAMVAEAGWTAERDHAAIAHVLHRRWERARVRYPNLRFVDQIRGFCSGLHKIRSARHKWIHGLNGPTMPVGWPEDKARWDRHLGYWEAIKARVKAFRRGELRDPCRGRAWNWGGNMDVPRGPVVDCGETKNTFTGL